MANDDTGTRDLGPSDHIKAAKKCMAEAVEHLGRAAVAELKRSVPWHRNLAIMHGSAAAIASAADALVNVV